MNGKKKQPLYDQLVDVLKEKIETELDANDMLPSERELSETYHLSRTTVRLALQELEKLGYIYRLHGKGTFVSDLSKQVANLSSAYSFTEQMKSLGKTPKTKILSLEVLKANKYIASQLHINVDEEIYRLKRLRLADNQPMMVERSYLPKKKFPNLTTEILSQQPLYDVFYTKYGEIIRLANEEFFASIARSKDAKLLEVMEGSPVLNLIRTTYNMENEVIEFTLSVARADQFRYQIRHLRHE